MEKLILIMDIELEKVVGGARFSTEQKKFFISIGSLVAVTVVATVTTVVMGYFIVKFRRAASHVTELNEQITRLTGDNLQLRTQILQSSPTNANTHETTASNSEDGRKLTLIERVRSMLHEFF